MQLTIPGTGPAGFAVPLDAAVVPDVMLLAAEVPEDTWEVMKELSAAEVVALLVGMGTTSCVVDVGAGVARLLVGVRLVDDSVVVTGEVPTGPGPVTVSVSVTGTGLTGPGGEMVSVTVSVVVQSLPRPKSQRLRPPSSLSSQSKGQNRSMRGLLGAIGTSKEAMFITSF